MICRGGFVRQEQGNHDLVRLCFQSLLFFSLQMKFLTLIVRSAYFSQQIELGEYHRVNLDALCCPFRLYLNAPKVALPVRDAQAPTALPSIFLAKSNSYFLYAPAFIRILAIVYPEKVIVEAIEGIPENMQHLISHILTSFHRTYYESILRSQYRCCLPGL